MFLFIHTLDIQPYSGKKVHSVIDTIDRLLPQILRQNARSANRGKIFFLKKSFLNQNRSLLKRKKLNTMKNTWGVMHTNEINK